MESVCEINISALSTTKIFVLNYEEINRKYLLQINE